MQHKLIPSRPPYYTIGVDARTQTYTVIATGARAYYGLPAYYVAHAVTVTESGRRYEYEFAEYAAAQAFAEQLETARRAGHPLEARPLEPRRTYE